MYKPYECSGLVISIIFVKSFAYVEPYVLSFQIQTQIMQNNKIKSSPLTFDSCFSSTNDFNDTYDNDQIKIPTNPRCSPR